MRAGRENIDVNADKGLKGSSIKKIIKYLVIKHLGIITTKQLYSHLISAA